MPQFPQNKIESMMDLQIRALKKKTVNKKLLFYSRKDYKINQNNKVNNPNSFKKSLSNFVFAFFKDTPEKLLDFPYPQSLSQIRNPKKHENLNHHNEISLLRRKKIQHHEETYPLFSRI